MADIKEAAKWINEGRKVRRKAWPLKRYAFKTLRSSTQIAMIEEDYERGAALSLESILAEDWEIAE